MSKLFIYYSFSGNGDAVAARLKEKGFEVRKVESEFKLSEKLFPQMMKGGFSAYLLEKAIGNWRIMISFYNDYSEGAHERIIEALTKTNRVQ